MNQIFSILLIYVGLFLVFTVIKAFFKGTFMEKILFCTVCAAWITHLILGFILNYPLPILTLMMGMTITGMAYFFWDIFYKKERYISFFFVFMLILTIIGLWIIQLMS